MPWCGPRSFGSGVEQAHAEIYLKLENLQPIGSFKLRGASNAMALADPADLARGVYTASAGNMAQGVAWNARRLGIPCRVVVPEGAPETKLRAIARLGAVAVKKPFAEWWNVLVEHGHPRRGRVLHPPRKRPRRHRRKRNGRAGDLRGSPRRDCRGGPLRWRGTQLRDRLRS